MRVAIIGGGIAGCGIAMALDRIGVEFTLFEKRTSLVGGPPMCHLHAGGNLYPDIDDAQRLQLLEESLELMRFFPQAVDYRPTIIAVPKSDSNDPEELAKRAKILQEQYAKLCQKDPKNRLLGDPKHYVTTFTRADLTRLGRLSQPNPPRCPDEWMIPFAKEVDLERIKFPVLLVQEFGLNIFRIAATAQTLLEKRDIRLGTEVIDIQNDQGYLIRYSQNGSIHEERYDYLINAAGFESGRIDDALGYGRKRFVEFKAAYVTRWESRYHWPEVIFHGQRGTKEGMGQFTPYAGGYVQLHGMSEEITLFEDGLVRNEAPSAQPKLPQKYIEMIEKSWDKELSVTRTRRAISHLGRFIPAFQSARPAAKPLYGAQQIPGTQATLRAAEVSFENSYARCEIVKASSITAMAKAIAKDVGFTGEIPIDTPKLDSKKLDEAAMRIAADRGYPPQMGLLGYPSFHECP